MPQQYCFKNDCCHKHESLIAKRIFSKTLLYQSRYTTFVMKASGKKIRIFTVSKLLNATL